MCIAVVKTKTENNVNTDSVQVDMRCFEKLIPAVLSRVWRCNWCAGIHMKCEAERVERMDDKEQRGWQNHEKLSRHLSLLR